MHILSCRDSVSDRFPVASFALKLPSSRYYEVACATDPRLFHPAFRGQRTRRNFYSSREAGLLRSETGDETWILPSAQLQSFAGADRVYYALGSYGSPRGNDPRFSISPESLDRVPSFELASDFTGRSLDRSRLRGSIGSQSNGPGDAGGSSARYGGSEQLRWGGDDALETAHQAAHRDARGGIDRRASIGGEADIGADYDDGFDDDFWMRRGAGRALEKSVESKDPDAYDELEPAERGADDTSSADGEDVGPEDAAEIVPPDLDHDEDRQVVMPGDDAPAPMGLGDEGVVECHDDQQPDDEAGGVDLEDTSGDATGANRIAGLGAYGNPSWDDAQGFDLALEAGGDVDAASEHPDASDDAASDAAEERVDVECSDDHDEAREAPPDGAPVVAPSSYGFYGAPQRSSSSGNGTTAVVEAPNASSDADPDEPGGKDADYSEEEEEEPLPAGAASRPLDARPLTIADKIALLRVVARSESGRHGYAAINPDNEFRNPNHRAYQRYHIGLSWGFVQFTQRSGMLGRVLRAAKAREEQLRRQGTLDAAHSFATVFGPDHGALLEVTTADTAEARVAPVGGAPLWEEPWISRFRAAGAIPYFQHAQNEIAVTHYFDPNLPMCGWLGFDRDRALAMFVDRCINMGNGGGRRWIMDAVGPLRSQADVASALQALGHADLRAFQRSYAPALDADGAFGPQTHAALVHALRHLEPARRGGIEVLDPAAMLERMVQHAAGRRFARRVRGLHEDRTRLTDVVFVLS